MASVNFFRHPMAFESLGYRCGPHQRFSLGPGFEFIRFPLAGFGRSVSSLEAAALGRWVSFSSIETAAREAIAALPSLSFDDAWAMFNEIHGRGGLAAYTDVVPDADPNRASGGCIESVSIPTNGRADLLRRCIDSYAQNLSTNGRCAELFVADDSSDGGVAEYLSLATSAWPGATYYAGPAEKAAFATLLSESIPPETINYALFGSPLSKRKPGANRNAILLFTLGALTMSIDDDSYCDPASSPTFDSAGVAIGGHDRTDEIWCYPDPEAISRSIRPCKIDILKRHESLLGLALQEVLWRSKNSAEPIHLQNMCSHLFTSLLTGTGRIAITSNGARGDSGFHSDLPIVGHNSVQTRRRVQDLGNDYGRVLSSRLILRQSPRASITHPEATCVGMHLGMDNRCIGGGLLPPFPPDYDSEDSIFFQLVGCCNEGRYAGHLPFTLAHGPESGRSYSSDRGTRYRVADVLGWCVSTWRPSVCEQTDSARLRSLGRHLQELADQEAEGWRETLAVLACSWRSARIQYLDTLIADDAFRCDLWAEDIADRVNTLRKEAESDSLVPADMGDHEADQVVDALRSAVRKYGALVELWPAITETARALSAVGTRIGRRLMPLGRGGDR